MSLTVTEFMDVRQRANELGLIPPEKLVFLPRNFENVPSQAAMVYEDTLPDVRRLLGEAGVEFGRLEEADKKQRYVKENSFDWILPTVFVTLATYKANPDLFKTIVTKLWEHSKIVFTAVTGRTRIKWDIIIEDDGKKRTKRVSFDGAAEEFRKVQGFLETLLKSPEKKNVPAQKGKAAQKRKPPPKNPSKARRKKK